MLIGAGVAGALYAITKSEKQALIGSLVFAVGWEIIDSTARNKKIYARDMFFRAAGGGITLTIIHYEF